jgi:hypothetical protein
MSSKPFFDMDDRDDRIGVFIICLFFAVLTFGVPLSLLAPFLAPWPALSSLIIGGLIGWRVVRGLSISQKTHVRGN